MRNRPPEGSTFSTILASRAHAIPDDLVYIFLRDGETDEERMTYRELHRRAAAIACTLVGAVSPGARALILMPPGLDYVVALFGCFHAGVVAVSATPPHPKRLQRTLPRLLAIAADADAHCVLTTKEIKDVAEPFLGDTQTPLAEVPWLTEQIEGDLRLDEWGTQPQLSSDLAFLQYTSGSTREPRGVMLSHDHLVGMCRMLSKAWRLTPERDLGFNWLPPYHDMGLISVMVPVYVGTASVLTSPLSIIKRPMRWLEGISRYKATTSGGPNFAYDLCVERFNPADSPQLDLSSWDVAANGAEPIRASTLDAFVECFAPYGFKRTAFYPCYGLAEATLLVTGVQKEDPPVHKSLSARALEQGEARDSLAGEAATILVGCGASDESHRVLIVDAETRSPCPPKRVGEIWVSGPAVTHGYWRRPAETAEAFELTPDCEADGESYLRTGDLGVELDGELYVVGRIKDVLILNGRNVHPHDIEASAEGAHQLLRAHCSAAFPLDGALSSQIGIVIETNPHDGTELDAVITAIRREIAADLELQVALVALCTPGSVPKTTSGKVQRSLCQTLLANGELEVVEKWRDGE